MPRHLSVTLKVEKGTSKDRQIVLPPTFFVIGRDPRCHLRPHCKWVSRLHCAIASWSGRVLVRDLKSSNGTYVNGRKIDAEVAVKPGDLLSVGNLVFSIQMELVDSGPRSQGNGELEWLLNTPEEPVLDPKFDTCCEIAIPEAHIATEDDSRSNCDVAALSARNNSVGSGMSAGQYLRDFFATQMTLTRKRFANGQ